MLDAARHEDAPSAAAQGTDEGAGRTPRRWTDAHRSAWTRAHRAAHDERVAGLVYPQTRDLDDEVRP